MKCRKCGAEYGEDVKFCTKCGASMEDEGQDSQAWTSAGTEPAKDAGTDEASGAGQDDAGTAAEGQTEAAADGAAEADKTAGQPSVTDAGPVSYTHLKRMRTVPRVILTMSGWTFSRRSS